MQDCSSYSIHKLICDEEGCRRHASFIVEKVGLQNVWPLEEFKKKRIVNESPLQHSLNNILVYICSTHEWRRQRAEGLPVPLKFPEVFHTAYQWIWTQVTYVLI